MIKSFFDELRALDEATKRKIMVIVTGVVMVGIIYVWLGYFNGLVANSEPQQGQTTQGFLATIGNEIVQAFKNPGQYTIHASQSGMAQ